MVTLHEVITFLVSMQISISSLQTHNVNRCGRSRHLARKLSLRRKRICFFQAEDGIRDRDVTGVQTCALPISECSAPCGAPAGGGYDIYARLLARHMGRYIPGEPNIVVRNMPGAGGMALSNHIYSQARSEECRVGKECESRWGPKRRRVQQNRQ